MTSGYGFDGPGPSNNRSACTAADRTEHDAAGGEYAAVSEVSGDERSELAGAASVREAGIRLAAKRLRGGEVGAAGEALPALAQAAQRVLDAGAVADDKPAGELGGCTRDPGDIGVGEGDACSVRGVLHGRRGRERGGGGVLRARCVRRSVCSMISTERVTATSSAVDGHAVAMSCAIDRMSSTVSSLSARPKATTST